ncbi:alanyl-tRNA editing protein [Thermosipho atlanticus]|uniref:Alanyl-tRNA synthetase n=1 Tax=Thermosipho atlanticus DSM 15807 TaxID=1123380 RepID=A0A1M5TJW7_9BACT|nr:alanyl-tRNA editing protein [Thermosipho atlanticus]SHH50976.1 alanyl-tRNA synthetase [Thermosipho atlanticus DSM 15807]
MKIKIDRVVIKDGNIYLESGESPFYPDFKGGQLGDRGKIGNVKVIGVEEIEGKIYHRVNTPLEPGEYDVTIDEEHRLFIKQHHTAQHILSAVFSEYADIRTVSFKMGMEYSTIDLDIPFLAKDVLQEVEINANKLIQKCLDVEELVVEKEDLDKFPLRKKVSDKIKGKIRIIKIGEYDYSACAGYHVKNTGEIGFVKIIKTEKVKGSLTRVYFVAGLKALSYFYKYTNILRNLSKLLTASIDELEERTKNLLDKVKSFNSKIENISEILAKEKAENLKAIRDSVYYIEIEESIAKYIPKYFKKENALLVLYDGIKFNFVSFGKYNVNQLISKIRDRIPGKGGGGEKKGTFIPEKKTDINEIIEFLEV